MKSVHWPLMLNSKNPVMSLFGIVFGGLSEFWKSSFLSPPSTIPKSGFEIAIQLLNPHHKGRFN